jgi:putative CocE/NonD family hydrolase
MGYYNYLLENGYVLAIQDVRGRFGSEGKFIPFMNEGKDGYDAIEWIARQHWSDGNIGMIGASYNGWVQYCAAVERPLHLKTIIPNCAVADLFCETPYRYGVFVPGMLSWSKIIEEEATADLSGKKIREISDEPWGKLLDQLPVSQLDMKVLSKKLDYYQEWVQHDSDDSYWKQACSLEKMKEINIPVFIQTGWFDTQLLGGKLAYNELIKSGNKNVKLIIGPWGHTDKESKYYKGKLIGEAGDDINLQEQYVRWFNYWLKGIKNDIMDEPKVQLYALNSDKWYSDNKYPLKNTSAEKFFLSANNGANLKENGALILDLNELNPGIDKYLYNPQNVPIYNQKETENSISIVPGYIQEILANRDDYLFYKSKSIEKPTTLLGQLSAKIYASSSALDTDWFLLLMVLDNNDNFIDKIGFGMLRAKFRNSLEKPELLQKDKIYQFEIDLNQCGITIEKGQKIGLIITSSFLYPFFAKNLNTGKNSQIETDYKIAEQKIYHTKEYSSYISLPILNDGEKK